MNCIICSKECTKLARDIVTEKEKLYKVYRCRNCRFIFVDPLPHIGEMLSESVFGKDYYSKFCNKKQDYFSEEILNLESKVANLQNKFVSSLLSGRKYLDIGCGDGKMLSLMKGLGWDCTGVEISGIAASYGRGEYSVDIRTGELKQQDYPEKSFDFITMRHVIEHLYNPVEVVKEAHKLLKNNGVLRVDTDNCDSILNNLILAGLLGKNKESLGKLYPPAHNFYFSAKNLSMLLKKAGFKIIKIMCPAQGHPEHFPKPDKYSGGIKDKLKQLIDDVGGVFNRGEVVVVYARKE